MIFACPPSKRLNLACQPNIHNPSSWASDVHAGGTVRQTLTTDGCTGADAINRLEHVQVYVQMEHSRRGDLALTLISPKGTESEILSERPNDDSEDGTAFSVQNDINFSTVKA